jgi:UDP-glucose 4-epimerase
MNILVTGGAGYIGSITVEALIARGHAVTVLDNLSTGYLAAVHPKATLLRSDLRNVEVISRAIRAGSIEAVIHFAASSLVGESMIKPIDYFDNNVVGTICLLQAMIEQGVTRLVFSSTAALFGKVGRNPIPEDAPIQPKNVYGESKNLVERILRWLPQINDLGFASLRYFNAAGASRAYGEDHRPETHLIPLTLHVAMGIKDAIDIYGENYHTPDGTCIRDYVHVLDLAQAHSLAVEAIRPGETKVYNVGNGVGFSVHEVVDVCRRITRHPIPVRLKPPRGGDPPVLVADSAQIRRELGWDPRWMDLEEIVASAWDWHKRHPRGYGVG